MNRKSILRRLQLLLVVVSIIVTLSFSSCKQPKVSQNEPYKVVHPEWVYNATIYEVNVRQYTQEGTFKAFESHLPRLKELGVDILWFMPITPVGELNKKGSLGSYYCVKDYLSVNPKFGTKEDFKKIVEAAHRLGMKVILDWVANHTSHDAVLVHDHPDWYVHDSLGNIVSPHDWIDVLKLDYSKKELRDYMINAMEYWVKEFDIDGYRCDVAYDVPTDFWNELRIELNKIKPVFLLAESEQLDHQKYAFDANYGWEFHHLMNSIAKEQKTVKDLEKYLLKEVATYPKNTIKMNFITNHDENRKATEYQRMGSSLKTFAALYFTLPGIPLIYSGQEVGQNKRLKEFDYDCILWNDSLSLFPFYKKLVELKKSNSVLAAGLKGADIERVKSSNDSSVFAFIRKNDAEKMFAVFNLSGNIQKISFEGDDYLDTYKDYLSGDNKLFEKGGMVELKPWEFHIFIKK